MVTSMAPQKKSRRSPQEIEAFVREQFQQRRFRFGFSYVRMANWLAGVVLFALASTVVLGIALGYQVDWENRRIVRTGLIEVHSNLNDLPASVFLNGELVASRLPLRQYAALPGTYEVRIEREGYQPWSYSVDVRENERVRLRGVLLTYTELRPAAVTDIRIDDPRFAAESSSGLEVRSNNELWLDEKLIARYSADVRAPRWYSGRQGAVVQAGSTLLYVMPSLPRTQVLYRLPSEKSRFFFEQGGRVLVYTDPRSAEPAVYRTELFESTRILDRFFTSASDGATDLQEADR